MVSYMVPSPSFDAVKFTRSQLSWFRKVFHGQSQDPLEGRRSYISVDGMSESHRYNSLYCIRAHNTSDSGRPRAVLPKGMIWAFSEEHGHFPIAKSDYFPSPSKKDSYASGESPSLPTISTRDRKSLNSTQPHASRTSKHTPSDKPAHRPKDVPIQTTSSSELSDQSRNSIWRWGKRIRSVDEKHIGGEEPRRGLDREQQQQVGRQKESIRDGNEENSSKKKRRREESDGEVNNKQKRRKGDKDVVRKRRRQESDDEVKRKKHRAHSLELKPPDTDGEESDGWDPWPNTNFQRHYTHEEGERSKNFLMHWSYVADGGSRTGSATAPDPAQGRPSRRRCNGVIVCNNPNRQTE
jgi:hypothetical protein